MGYATKKIAATTFFFFFLNLIWLLFILQKKKTDHLSKKQKLWPFSHKSMIKDKSVSNGEMFQRELSNVHFN